MVLSLAVRLGGMEFSLSKKTAGDDEGLLLVPGVDIISDSLSASVLPNNNCKTFSFYISTDSVLNLNFTPL